MNDHDLKQLIDRGFPRREEAFPSATIWRRIDAALDLGALPQRRTRRAWMLAAAAIVVLSLSFLLVWVSGPEEPSKPIDRILADTERAQMPLRDWVIANRPREWQLNEPAVLALDRAIEETRALLEEKPGNAGLSSRIAMYARWREDLIAGLAYENG